MYSNSQVGEGTKKFQVDKTIILLKIMLVAYFIKKVLKMNITVGKVSRTPDEKRRNTMNTEPFNKTMFE